jgi:hypothetical protein
MLQLPKAGGFHHEQGSVQMQRRMVLTGAGASAAGVFSGAASAADTMAANPTSSGLVNTLARSRASIPAHFDRTYMENAVVPFFLTGIYEGERPALPMIDVTLTKENALPHDLWGLIYQGWKPTPEEGVTVFLQGLEKRGTTTFGSGSTCPDDKLGIQHHIAASPEPRAQSQCVGGVALTHLINVRFSIDVVIGVC